MKPKTSAPPVPVEMATAATGEITIGANTYRMRPLCDEEYGELTNWLKARVRALAVEFAEGMPPSDRAAVMANAAEDFRNMDLLSPKAPPLLASREGAAFIVWLGLRHEHPGVTVEQLKREMAAPGAADATMAQFDQINAIPSMPEPPEAEGEPEKKTPSEMSAEGNSTTGLPVPSDGTPTA